MKILVYQHQTPPAAAHPCEVLQCPFASFSSLCDTFPFLMQVCFGSVFLRFICSVQAEMLRGSWMLFSFFMLIPCINRVRIKCHILLPYQAALLAFLTHIHPHMQGQHPASARDTGRPTATTPPAQASEAGPSKTAGIQPASPTKPKSALAQALTGAKLGPFLLYSISCSDSDEDEAGRRRQC